MFSGEMARYQIQDRVRDAEAARVARSLKKAGGGAGFGRRLAGRAATLFRRTPEPQARLFTEPSRGSQGAAVELG